MKPSRFDYVRATDVESALDALRGGEAKLIAGGQSLLPMMNLRVAAPERLIDVDGVRELDTVVVADGELVIGALTRHDRLARDPAIRRAAPLLYDAARHIGHVAIRNRGTIGGSLAHADPTAELPAACIAVCATIVCDRADGRRRELPAEEFFQGLYSTALEPDEMITWVRVPTPAGLTYGFSEIAPREGDFAWAGAGVARSDDRIRLVVFGLESVPGVLEVDGPTWQEVGGVVDTWIDGLEPNVDPAFRRDLAKAMARRAVAAAEERRS